MVRKALYILGLEFFENVKNEDVCCILPLRLQSKFPEVKAKGFSVKRGLTLKLFSFEEILCHSIISLISEHQGTEIGLFPCAFLLRSWTDFDV